MNHSIREFFRKCGADCPDSMQLIVTAGELRELIAQADRLPERSALARDARISIPGAEVMTVEYLLLKSGILNGDNLAHLSTIVTIPEAKP